MHSTALRLVSFVDGTRRPRVSGPGARVPGPRGASHGGPEHFFSTMPWLAWPLAAVAVLVFLALLPLRLFGSAPWYVRLGLLASAVTGLLLWRRSRVGSARL